MPLYNKIDTIKNFMSKICNLKSKDHINSQIYNKILDIKLK